MGVMGCNGFCNGVAKKLTPALMEAVAFCNFVMGFFLYRDMNNNNNNNNKNKNKNKNRECTGACINPKKAITSLQQLHPS